MNSRLVPLTDAVARVGDAWDDATDTTGLSRAGLIVVNEALASSGRVVDALKVGVAAGIAHESRRELGVESLAKQQGFRSPVQHSPNAAASADSFAVIVAPAARA